MLAIVLALTSTCRPPAFPRARAAGRDVPPIDVGRRIVQSSATRRCARSRRRGGRRRHDPHSARRTSFRRARTRRSADSLRPARRSDVRVSSACGSCSTTCVVVLRQHLDLARRASAAVVIATSMRVRLERHTAAGDGTNGVTVERQRRAGGHAAQRRSCPSGFRHARAVPAKSRVLDIAIAPSRDRDVDFLHGPARLRQRDRMMAADKPADRTPENARRTFRR